MIAKKIFGLNYFLSMPQILDFAQIFLIAAQKILISPKFLKIGRKFFPAPPAGTAVLVLHVITKAWGTLLRRGLWFVQRRCTRNSVKEHDPTFGWTN